MQTATKSRTTSALSDNALARKALEAIAEIDKEAEEKRKSQVATLRTAKAAIEARIKELEHQVSQLDDAMTTIQGEPEQTGRRQRRNLDEVRQKVKHWLQGRKGHKFRAGEIIREFPELDGMVMSIVLKPLIEDGEVQTDTSEGIRRTKYFVS